MADIYSYEIKKKIQATSNVVLLNVVPESGEVFNFKPGQFAMITLFDKDGNPWQKRVFSIASSPTNKKELQFAIKTFGEFTQRITTLKEGDKIGVSGPFGSCSFDEKEMKDVVFFVGGIGITPYMSIIRYVTDKNLSNKITLIYSNKNKDDIVFRNELEEIAKKNKNFKLVFTLTNDIPERWEGEKGRVDKAMVEKYCPILKDKHFFLCGPPPFMEAIKECLIISGASEDQIKHEKF